MPKADPFTQRRLLDLAEVDRQLTAARHRRGTLPELARVTALEAGFPALRSARIEAETEVGDLGRAVRKLDTEIEAVRARSDRDHVRLTSGQAGAKELENLQHEVESLKRRQGVLEDDALELMDRKETADAVLTAAVAAVTEAEADLAEVQQQRDAALTLLAEDIAGLEAKRESTAQPLPKDLLDLYDKVRARGGTAAGELTGGRCGACRMELEKAELDRLRTAPVDEVCRCPECSAILIRH